MVNLDEAIKAAMTPDAPLTVEAMWGFIAIIEAHRAAWQEVASLPPGHVMRNGITQRRLKSVLKEFDGLLRSCRNALRYLDD